MKVPYRLVVNEDAISFRKREKDYSPEEFKNLDFRYSKLRSLFLKTSVFLFISVAVMFIVAFIVSNYFWFIGCVLALIGAISLLIIRPTLVLVNIINNEKNYDYLVKLEAAITHINSEVFPPRLVIKKLGTGKSIALMVLNTRRKLFFIGPNHYVTENTLKTWNSSFLMTFKECISFTRSTPEIGQKVIGGTWQYTKKDGTRDKRYSVNPYLSKIREVQAEILFAEFCVNGRIRNIETFSEDNFVKVINSLNSSGTSTINSYPAPRAKVPDSDFYTPEKTSSRFKEERKAPETIKGKYSSDPKTKLWSIEYFYFEHEYLISAFSNKNKLPLDRPPEPWSLYYKITPDKFIAVLYGGSLSNFGTEIKDKLTEIQVAYRDGVTEYQLLDNEINRLRHDDPSSDLLTQLLRVKKSLPKYQASENKNSDKKFEDYLVNIDYTPIFSDKNQKYVVFDVETNGLRPKNDDLLSISIYDPQKGVCYNRYLPLDLQPLVLTTFIHGITDEDLADATHLDQDEVNQIIDFFDLKNTIILSYSGGKGVFDFNFLNNYCKRHDLTGFENLTYKNIKDYVPEATYELRGKLTKDNLCNVFDIEGITQLHSSMNDCVLEWKLFEKLYDKKLFFIDNRLYEYHDEYVIPVSYLSKYPQLATFANIEVPNVEGRVEELYSFKFPNSIIQLVKKFGTNISGIAIEHAINTLLNAEDQNEKNSAFLKSNFRHLELVGRFKSNVTEIPIVLKEDGTIETSQIEHQPLINEVNESNKVFMETISPIVEFIKENIFVDEKIMSQELVITPDHKILAKCDLSSKTSIMEIKVRNIVEYGQIPSGIAKQIYYQQAGRKTYLLNVKFDAHLNEKYEEITDGISIIIYRVNLEVN